jgi:putative ABC transport system permease protein
MIKNYLKTAFRSLVKNRVFTLINVLGLFLGLTAFLLIYAYVGFEKSYDGFHPNADRIYRVVTDNVVNGVTGARDAMSFSPLGLAMKEELPEVEEYTTTMKLYENLIFKKGDELINETGVVAADEKFLTFFPYKILHGNDNPFKDPQSLVLTRSAALRLFGVENALGQTMEVAGIHAGNYKVTGILEDPPGNTHYKFKVLISFKTIEDRARDDGWRGYNFYTYVRLAEGVSMEEVQAKMPAFPDKYLSPDSNLEFTLQPLTDIHLTTGFTYEPEANGNERTVNFLFLIALFIIVIAWVNYINLSTARAMDRAREVGMRKVVGAGRYQLMLQFMLESLFINFFAAILALTAVQVLGPWYNNLLGKDLIQFVWNNTSLLNVLLITTLIGSLFSGFYPSIVLSSFKPIVVLKGKLRNSKNGLLLRKGLVVFQFIASMVLISGTAIVYLQIQYMKNRDLGVDIEQVLTLAMPPYDEDQAEEFVEKYERLRTELGRLPQIAGVATSSSIPGGGRSNIASSSGGLTIMGETERDQSTIYTTRVDEYFFPVMGIDVLAGRNFTDNWDAEEQNVIINEAILERLGYAGGMESVLNKRLRIGDESSQAIFNIVGVVNNYNRRSLKDEIEPTVYFLGYESFMTNVAVRIAGEDMAQAVAAIEENWFNSFPEVPFDYSFMDERFNAAYQEDQQFGSIFGSFSILAIAIACLGLFGLSSFIAIQRSKEIGVRKVLGASVGNIVTLVSKDFLYLVIIAFALGSPLVYFIMQSWLGNYAFRIDLPVWVLPVAGLTLLLITFITVGYQTSRAARANPVDALRSE